MRILLDTHTIVWAANGTLAPNASALIEDMANELYFSPVNIWEIELKRTRLNFEARVLHQNLVHNGYRELAVTTRHVLEIKKLPLLHSDPFDRLLLAQALTEGLFLLTSDEMLRQYSESVDCIISFNKK